MQLEICVDSVRSARAAFEGGKRPILTDGCLVYKSSLSGEFRFKIWTQTAGTSAYLRGDNCISFVSDADRIELCSALALGGLTPTVGTYVCAWHVL